MCVKPFKMNRNKSPLKVPTGWSTDGFEGNERHLFKNHIAHI